MCDNKQNCRVRASHRIFKETPCPFSQLEVGYQCIPEYQSKTVSCLGTELVLQCPSSLRILILYASYGYKWPGESKCMPKIGFDSECLSTCATYVVASRCHGQKSCRVFVDAPMFGEPCRPGTFPYLTVHHACVPSKILVRTIKKKDFPFSECSYGPVDNTTNGDFDYFKPHILTSTLPTSTVDTFMGTQGRLLPHWVTVGLFIKGNIEKFILYFILGAFVGLVLLLLVVTFKLVFEAKYLKTRRMLRSSILDPRSAHRLSMSPARRSIAGRSFGDTPYRSGGVEYEIELLRAPETPRHTGPSTISVEEIPSRLSAPDDGSPVFVHVESPRESPLLGRNNSNGDSNGERYTNERILFPRIGSLPYQSSHSASFLHESLLLPPRHRQISFKNNSASSEGQLKNVAKISSESDYEFLPQLPPAVPSRSTSALPHLQDASSRLSREELSDQALSASQAILHSFTNPFRNDESLGKRQSSIRRKPPYV